jgi:peptide/nickel transport system substrate-binding protein
VARALAAAIAVSLLAVSGAGASPAQTPKRGGTLVFRMISAEPACLNVLDARCQGAPVRAIAEKVLEKPFAVGPDFTFRPRLVSSYSFTRKRPFTLVYRIRPEARWSDGVPVTARDFVFTLQAIRRHGNPLEREFHSVVRQIRAVDAKTLRVVLRPRFAGWRQLFGNVLPSHALRGEDLTKVWSDRIDTPKTGRPIGSGPFLVERWERGRQIVLRRNPRYWGPHVAYLDRLVVRFSQAPDDPSQALREDEFDVATGVRIDLFPSVRKAPGVRVYSTPSNGFEHFDLRLGPGGHPALKNKLVRRALAFRLNRVALVRELYGDINPAWGPLDNTLFFTNARHYEANWKAYRYRPRQARRLLEQAGCRRGADGVYMCAGDRLSLRFLTSAGNRTRERVISSVQLQLRQIGFEVKPVFATSGALFDQIISNGAFDVALFGWVFTNPDSAGFRGIYGCGGSQNYTGYCQRLVTKDLDQSERILDARQRARVLNRADRQLARDVPVIPLFQFVQTAASDADVRNYAMHPLSAFWNAENWWLER